MVGAPKRPPPPPSSSKKPMTRSTDSLLSQTTTSDHLVNNNITPTPVLRFPLDGVLVKNNVAAPPAIRCSLPQKPISVVSAKKVPPPVPEKKVKSTSPPLPTSPKPQLVTATGTGSNSGHHYNYTNDTTIYSAPKAKPPVPARHKKSNSIATTANFTLEDSQEPHMVGTEHVDFHESEELTTAFPGKEQVCLRLFIDLLSFYLLVFLLLPRIASYLFSLLSLFLWMSWPMSC